MPGSRPPAAETGASVVWPGAPPASPRGGTCAAGKAEADTSPRGAAVAPRRPGPGSGRPLPGSEAGPPPRTNGASASPRPPNPAPWPLLRRPRHSGPRHSRQRPNSCPPPLIFSIPHRNPHLPNLQRFPETRVSHRRWWRGAGFRRETRSEPRSRGNLSRHFGTDRSLRHTFSWSSTQARPVWRKASALSLRLTIPKPTAALSASEASLTQKSLRAEVSDLANSIA